MGKLFVLSRRTRKIVKDNHSHFSKVNNVIGHCVTIEPTVLRSLDRHQAVDLVKNVLRCCIERGDHGFNL